jgi:hypothetical protein
LAAVPGEAAGAAGGQFSTAQQLGGALGVALVGTVFFSELDGQSLTDSFTDALPIVVGLFLLAAVLALAVPRTAVGEEAAEAAARPDPARTQPADSASGERRGNGTRPPTRIEVVWPALTRADRRVGGTERFRRLWAKAGRQRSTGPNLTKRRGWDSNPRWTEMAHNGFRDRRIQPLCHPSGTAVLG